MAEQVRPWWAVRLRNERRARGWTQRDLADRLAQQVTEQCPELDCLITYIKRWESGKSTVSKRYRLALAAAFEVRHDELFAPPASVRDETMRQIPATPWDGPARSVENADSSSDWDEMKRRLLLQLAAVGGAGALAATGEPVRLLLEQILARAPRSVGDWEIACADHLHAIRTRPPAQIRDDLPADLLVLQRQIADPGDQDVTELQRIAAALSTLYANVLTRLGEHGAALRWWRTARDAADASGDLELRVQVRSEEAGFGLYGQRDPVTVLRLTEEARRLAAGRPFAGVASLAGTRAKAFSLLGRHAEAKRELLVLAGSTPHTSSSGPIPNLWREDQVHFAESWVHAAAGNEAEADEARERVLAFKGDYQYDVNVRLHEALCTVAQGGFEAGARHAATIFDTMPAARHSRMITETGRMILRAVPAEHRDHPAVADFRALLAAA
ncbi:helix-turn-helix domain-containing protein [Thermomonospora curvata]|uniref:Transcriptional regulator, XRE family n=1 Tax=Thermomonospora curvata (strain ATCC 19995 / DSM 43183 / JCM 3096 / KCTC 9072 / NBRC 15933 / NCIMB 10081 / Henssen B9) TaxID=471852 RepID=D1ABL1_THECD|nr:helix-turn-helix transcriptional regulator [Thermomonospora curvata]ACY97247.1 transcriptional regulator, XRE family [Thermomonospora curvata DSM 43183]